MVKNPRRALSFYATDFVLSPKQVAEQQGLSERRVRSLCARGDIFPVVNVGGRWLVKREYICAVTNHSPGRPKGRTGPYPKGVKRPRKPKPEEVQSSETK